MIEIGKHQTVAHCIEGLTLKPDCDNTYCDTIGNPTTDNHLLDGAKLMLDDVLELALADAIAVKQDGLLIDHQGEARSGNIVFTSHFVFTSQSDILV